MNESKSAAKIAKYLLETEAVKFNPENPFTWASGIKSPIYCDNRVLLSFPDVRSSIIDSFVEAIKNNYPEVEAISGVATAGIAHGALIADRMSIPYSYVRPEPKKHGMKNQIEGKLIPGSKVVVIEDLVSTGGSSLKAVAALREAGADVLGLVSIFTYGFNKATRAFEDANCKYVPLANLDELIETALEMNYLSSDQISTVKEMLGKADNA
jgi:orotate phosphoribosyltransferase